MNSYFLDKITGLEPHELPGFPAQAEMAPPYREVYDLEQVKYNNPRTAAVLILLYENQVGDLEFPIMLRNEYDGPHSNQFSLPGGQFEAEDITYDRTAVRETVEELGVFEEDIEILSPLTELYIPPSNFLVYPYIGVFKGVPAFDPDPDEVQFVVPIDLQAFVTAEPTYFSKKIKEESYDVPAYEIGEDAYIWGATAMVLEEFKVLIKNA